MFESRPQRLRRDFWRSSAATAAQNKRTNKQHVSQSVSRFSCVCVYYYCVREFKSTLFTSEVVVRTGEVREQHCMTRRYTHTKVRRSSKQTSVHHFKVLERRRLTVVVTCQRAGTNCVICMKQNTHQRISQIVKLKVGDFSQVSWTQYLIDVLQASKLKKQNQQSERTEHAHNYKLKRCRFEFKRVAQLVLHTHAVHKTDHKFLDSQLF